MSQAQPRNFYKLATVVLAVVIVFSAFVILYKFTIIDKPVYGSYTSLGIQLTPDNHAVKLSPNETYNLTYHMTNGTAPYVATWTLNPTGNFSLLVNGNLVSFNGSSQSFQSDELTVCYPNATDQYITVDLTVKDANGFTGSLLLPITIADPYTAPTQTLNSANVASFSYKIEADGLGWYRAISGLDGSIAFTSTNASTTINGAEVGAATVNGSVYISSGIYQITAVITQLSNTRIYGAGSGGSDYTSVGLTVLVQAYSGNVIYSVDSENVYINNLKILGGNGTYASGNGIEWDHVQQGIIEQVTSTNMPENGIYFGKNIGSDSCHVVNLIDCIIQDNQGCGLYAYGVYDSLPLINGGLYGGNQGYANVRLRECSSLTVSGIFADFGQIGVDVDTGRRVTVSNCIGIEYNQLAGIEIEGSGASDNIISGNICTNNGENASAPFAQLRTGIFVGGENNTIANNICKNIGTTTQQYGITEYTGSDYNTFIGNTGIGNVVTNAVNLYGTHSIISPKSASSAALYSQTSGQTILTFTSSSLNATYVVDSWLNIQSFTSGALDVRVAYTAENGTSWYIHIFYAVGAGTVTWQPNSAIPYTALPIDIRVKAGTPVSFYTTGTFNATYDIGATITQINP